MQTKLFLSLLVIVPLCAQEVDQQIITSTADVQKTETEIAKTAENTVSEVTKDSDQSAMPWTLTIEPARMDIMFCLTAKTEDVFADESVRNTLRTLLDDCRANIEKKDYEHAAQLLDQINASNPEFIKSAVIVGAHASGGLAFADVSYHSSPLGTFGMSGLLCSIDRSKVSAQAWKEITAMTLDTIRTNQELSYEQSKQLVFALITKI